MGTLLDLADGADAQLLQGLVVEFAAVVLAHAWTRPDRHHKVKLLMNGLVCAIRERPWVGPPARGRSPLARRSRTGRPVLADLARAGDHASLQSARGKADGPPLPPRGHDDDSAGAGRVLAVAAGGRCHHAGGHRDRSRWPT